MKAFAESQRLRLNRLGGPNWKATGAGTDREHLETALSFAMLASQGPCALVQTPLSLRPTPLL